MTKMKDFLTQLTPSSVIARMAIGALIGFVLIALFIFPIKDPDPAWGNLWRVRPLIITPLVAAFGFLSFYLMEYIQPKTDAGRIVIFLISTLAFLVALWMGFILGLDGTLWN